MEDAGMNRSKPIRVFYSVLSGRFYATRAWREVPGKPGVITVTGEKFDVTNDIAGLIEQHDITFTRSKKKDAAA
jgi:hypothetical protein